MVKHRISMAFRWRACLAAALVVACPSLWAQTTAPVPPTVAAQPDYPDSALFSGIEGEVRYRAHVTADGGVSRVDILSVPAKGHGFEDVVRRTVSDWRFTPAMVDGVVTAGTYEAVVPFTPTLPGEFVWPVRSDDAWAAIESLVKELRLSAAKKGQAQRLLITRPASYQKGSYPSVEQLGLPPGVKVETIEWHLWAPPGFTNARVAIAAVTQLRRSDGLMFTRYHDAVLARWFALQLSERLHHASTPLAAGPTRRYSQSPLDAAAWEGGAACPALPRPPVDLRSASPGVRRPSLLSQVIPHYPRGAMQAREQGVVTVVGVVTEHGTITDLSMDLGLSEELRLAAVTAVSLWRFSPATQDGCPIATKVTVEMSFQIRQ